MRKIIIIQCAGKKTQKSWRWQGKKVIFVADREVYKRSRLASGLTPCEPDDPISDTNSMTWRELFLEYYCSKKKPTVFLRLLIANSTLTTE